MLAGCEDVSRILGRSYFEESGDWEIALSSLNLQLTSTFEEMSFRSRRRRNLYKQLSRDFSLSLEMT
jgi:hypothetical protein